jgi:DNA-binding transcriptional MerR regulator/methylmalonyl-CoA mutase cobalamin-binding subunit
MRTGLSPHVLRIWERRHGAVTPRRSGANRRLYTAEEVARLILLKKAVDAGHAIGRIARLDDAVLAKLEQDLPMRAGEPESRVEVRGSESAAEHLDRADRAVRALDGAALEAALQRAAVGLSGPVLIGEVVLPLVERIGDLWQSGDLRIAQEHVATGEIRYFLSGLLHRQRVREGAPQLVVATPCGQAHELGALLVAVVAASLGWKVTYLGADLPAEEIAAVASSARAQGVALSLVYPAGDPAVAGELTRLRSFLPDSAAILLGGRAAAGYLHMIESSGFTRIESIAELPEILARIQERKK